MDRAKAVLPPIALPQDAQHFFGEVVWGVGILRVTVPEILLSKRNRCEFGILTDRPNPNELFSIDLAGLLDNVSPNKQILIGKAAWIRKIRSDSTHDSGQVNHYR